MIIFLGCVMFLFIFSSVSTYFNNRSKKKTMYAHFATTAVSLMKNASHISLKFAKNMSSTSGDAGSWFDARDVGTCYRLPPQHLTRAVVFVPRNPPPQAETEGSLDEEDTFANETKNAGHGTMSSTDEKIRRQNSMFGKRLATAKRKNTSTVGGKSASRIPWKGTVRLKKNNTASSQSVGASDEAWKAAGSTMLTREMARIVRRSSMKPKPEPAGVTPRSENKDSTNEVTEMVDNPMHNRSMVFNDLDRVNTDQTDAAMTGAATAVGGLTENVTPRSVAMVEMSRHRQEETAIDILFQGLPHVDDHDMDDEVDDAYLEVRRRSSSKKQARLSPVTQQQQQQQQQQPQQQQPTSFLRLPKRKSNKEGGKAKRPSCVTRQVLGARRSTFMSLEDVQERRRLDELDSNPPCHDNLMDLLQQHYLTKIIWVRDKWLTRPQRIAILFTALFTKMMITSFMFNLKQFTDIDRLVNNFTLTALGEYVLATLIVLSASSLVHRTVKKLHRVEAKLRKKVDMLTMRDFLAFGKPPQQSYSDRVYFEYRRVVVSRVILMEIRRDEINVQRGRRRSMFKAMGFRLNHTKEQKGKTSSVKKSSVKTPQVKTVMALTVFVWFLTFAVCSFSTWYVGRKRERTGRRG